MGTIVLVFGSSIAHGVWDSEGGWAGRLSRFLMERVVADEDDTTLYNLGVPGDTSANLLVRFRGEIKARFREGRQHLIILAIGLNDSARLSDKAPRIAPADFKHNVSSLIDQAKQFTPHIVSVGLTPVDEAKVAPAPWDASVYYRNETIRAFNEIIVGTAREKSVPFLDMLGVFDEADPDTFLDDGIHPNSVGHQKMFEHIRDFLIVQKLL